MNELDTSSQKALSNDVGSNNRLAATKHHSSHQVSAQLTSIPIQQASSLQTSYSIINSGNINHAAARNMNELPRNSSRQHGVLSNGSIPMKSPNSQKQDNQ